MIVFSANAPSTHKQNSFAMQFKDIIGQDAAVAKLRAAIDRNKLPHALLITGPAGTAGLPLAHAAAQYIICQHKHDGEPCGECPECIQAQKIGHPDLHWVYPVINKNTGDKDPSISDDYLPQWREEYGKNPNLTLPQWVRAMTSAKENNKQPQIFVSEASAIINTLSTKPYESDYRVMIIWLPELFSEKTANKLLKIIEEPYEKTFFLLVSNEPDNIIGTIQSRVQRLQLAPIDGQGNFVQPGVKVPDETDREKFLDLFIRMMRLSYMRNLSGMREWSLEMAKLKREQAKNFLQYAQTMIRENYIMNLREPALNYMKDDEKAFSERFSPYVNMRNVEGIMHELELAENDIGQNASAKMVFFDLSLKLIMLLKAGNQ